MQLTSPQEKIASAIAANEEASEAEIKAKMLQEIPVNLMRSVARTIGRRRRERCGGPGSGAIQRFHKEAMQSDPDGFLLQ